MHLSTFLEVEILDHILGTTAYTMPTVWVSLHDDSPGETGANELTGGSYARQTIAFNAAAAGTADNSSVEAWDLTGVTDGEVGWFGLWDAVSTGNHLLSIPFDGTSYTFTATDSGDVFTSYGHALANDDRVVLGTFPGSALPAGPTEDTVVYWIVGVSGSTFQISTTMGGGAVALTSDGEGIAFFIDFKSFSGGDTFNLAAGDLNVFSD